MLNNAFYVSYTLKNTFLLSIGELLNTTFTHTLYKWNNNFTFFYVKVLQNITLCFLWAS